MPLKHLIKLKYNQLARQEKEIIGQALVKVNLGVAIPSEHRIVAAFLKGTGIVAKPGALDELIEFFSEDEDQKIVTHAEGTKTISDHTPFKEEEIKELKEYPVDSEATLKERVDPKKLK